MKRSPRKRSAAEKAAKEEFDYAVRAKGQCVMASSEDPCDYHGRPPDCHHIIRQQTIRANTATLPEHERIEMLWDERNGAPLCRKHHDQVTTAFKRLTPLQLPWSVVTFAQDHGLEWALEREVPLFAESVR